MTMRMCWFVSVVLIFGAALGNAQDVSVPVERYVFLKHHGVSKYGERAFTAEQQLVPAAIEATEEVRVKIHGVWIDRSDVMSVSETIKHYTTQLESEPSNVTSLLRRGMAYQLADQFSSAIQDYSAVIKIDGGNAKAYECRGVTRFTRASKYPATSEATDLDAAISDLGAAIRLAPTDNRALIERGNLRRYMKDFDASLRDYTKGIRLNPSEPLAYFWRAKSLEAKGESEAALQDYSRAISIDGSSTLFLVGRGNLLRSMKNYEDAIEDYDKAIGLDSTCTKAFFHRAAAFQMAEKCDAAIADYTTVIRQDPPAVDAIRNRAVVFTACGQLDNAIDDFNAAVRIDPSNAEVFYLRGKVHGQQKRYAAAIEDFTESLRLDGTLAQSYRTRGLVYQKLGKYENAVRDFSEFIRLKPTNHWILNELALIYATCPEESVRDGAKGVDLAKRACAASNWKNPGYIETLAAAYSQASDWENAVSNQEKALQMAGTESEKINRRNRLSLYQRKETLQVPQPKME